jgi:ribosomal protein L29
MSFKDMAKLGAADLQKKEKDLRKEIMDLRFEHAVGKLLDNAAPRRKRRELAQVLTLLNAKANNT